MKKVILCGYMASGKTTTAQLLSKKLALPYQDLDEVIESRTGKSISQLFKEEGEIKFRKLEHEVLNNIVNGTEGFVLSLGGGTPCYANNHEVLKKDDIASFYIKTGVHILVERLRLQKEKRPLLQGLNGDELETFIAQHLFERSYYYHQAKHVINADGKSPEEITIEIAERV